MTDLEYVLGDIAEEGPSPTEDSAMNVLSSGSCFCWVKPGAQIVII